MTVYAIALALGTLSFVGSLAPILVGAIRAPERSPAQRAVLMWMATSLAIGAAMWVVRADQGTTTEFSELSRPIYTVAGLYALAELTARTRRRAWMYAAAAVYLVFWGWRIFEKDTALQFGPYNGPAQNALFTMAGLVVTWERITDRSRDSLRDFGLLIGLGSVISYGPLAALETVSHLLYASREAELMVPWALRGALLNIGLILFTLAFLWTIPPRSSSGPSPSAP